MRFGLGPVSLEKISRSELLAFATAATEASFDGIWVAEARDVGAGGGLAAAALVAQHTPIRVGASVEVGLYHPLYLAEDIAVADLTSGGRLEVMLRLPEPAASQRYGTRMDRVGVREHLSALASALAGAHVSVKGSRLRIPGRLDANQPAPSRLALNPAPAQPVVPVWVEAHDEWTAEVASRLGFGLAVSWSTDLRLPAAVGRWSAVVLCGPDVRVERMLEVAGEGSPYFLVQAATPQAAAAAGRRLAGPLRMPDFPEWANA